MLIKYSFILSACLLALMITIFKLFVQVKPRGENSVRYTHIMIWAFALYIFSAFLLIFTIDGVFNKSAAALFTASPFIIGRFASYKKETIFSVIQILCAALSAFYVYLT